MRLARFLIALSVLLLLGGCAQRAAEPPDGKKPADEQPGDRDLGPGADGEKLGQPVKTDTPSADGAAAACDAPPPAPIPPPP